MKLTSEILKAKAKELGIDCIAIGNIERFKNAPKLPQVIKKKLWNVSNKIKNRYPSQLTIKAAFSK